MHIFHRLIWFLCLNVFNIFLKKNIPKSLFAWRVFFHHNLGLFHLELQKWMWIFKGFGHSSYTHQWWVWSLYIEFLWALYEHFKTYWKCFYISCVVIMADESTDQTMEQHLIVYWCYLGSQGKGYQMTSFMELLAIQYTIGKNMFVALFFLLEELVWDLSKMVALTINGPTSMIGCHQGLST